MTFLELCQRTRLEAGIAGTGPASTQNQTGQLAKIVNWVRDAWTDIQLLRDWPWMWRRFTFDTTPGIREYTTLASVIHRLNRDHIWILRDGGRYDRLTLTDYDSFITVHARPDDPSEGVPTHVTVSPNKAIMLAPVPDGVYTIRGEYFKQPQILSADTDVPELPSEFHQMIVYRAVILYATHYGAPEVANYASGEFRHYINRLESYYQPQMWIKSEPLDEGW